MKFSIKKLDSCLGVAISMFFVFSIATIFSTSWASGRAEIVSDAGMVFEIFPENNHCGVVRAHDDFSVENTTIEVVAAKGTYKAGNSYDIVVSKKPIRTKNINFRLPQNFTEGLRARAEVHDNFYRVLIEEVDN
ncbi:MAG: hypothetical protein LBP39_02650 [Rickettsiales bacterium]|jgi:hypothetical protein|nr:hypothetical protein [Rickettsiales bacterium]